MQVHDLAASPIWRRSAPLDADTNKEGNRRAVTFRIAGYLLEHKGSKMKKQFGYYIVLGLLIGVVFGAGLGAANGNAMAGIGLGALFGMFIGWFAAAAALKIRNQQRRQTSDDS